MAFIYQFLSPVGLLDRRVLPVLLHEEVGGAVDVEGREGGPWSALIDYAHAAADQEKQPILSRF